jgi:transcription initiation factor TFIIIB Brf1 subunit/transcription initiation factor TFIIB
MFALNLRMPLRDASREVPRIVAAANLFSRVERRAIVLLKK